MKVGIPRGMYFYKYYPFAKAFLEELGAEVVPSPETTKEILDNGVKHCIDDACLPVKVYHGHTYKLREKADLLLIPRLTSVSLKEYICPKFGGLPEMVRYSVPELPPIIDIEINMHRNEKHLIKSLYMLGKALKIRNAFKIKKAYKKAADVHNSFKAEVLKGTTPDKLLKNLRAVEISRKHRIGIIGHPYLIYDSFINMKLLMKLEESSISYITPEMVDPHIVNERCKELSKRMFWSSAKSLIGSALYMMDSSEIDGLIMLTAFGCGIDSLAGEYIEHIARKHYNKPFMVMSLDEHTGDAGYNTRLEAFKNLLEWRCADDFDLSSHG
ncbi:MAG: acyl-CoA dehydratase activase-related protein [Bacillota bacterium]